MPKKKKKTNMDRIEQGATKATRWIGSTKSLIVHTIVFAAALVLPFFGIPFDMVLLVLTTFLSLEAIYLAIFIQMTVNKNTADIEEIQEDVEEIQEDIDEIQEDVDEIQEDVDEIQEDIEEIEEDHEQDQKQDQQMEQKELETLTNIQATLAQLSKEIEQIKKK